MKSHRKARRIVRMARIAHKRLRRSEIPQWCGKVVDLSVGELIAAAFDAAETGKRQNVQQLLSGSPLSTLLTRHIVFV